MLGSAPRLGGEKSGGYFIVGTAGAREMTAARKPAAARASAAATGWEAD